VVIESAIFLVACEVLLFIPGSDFPTDVCSARRQCTNRIVAFQSPKSLHDGTYAPLHIIS